MFGYIAGLEAVLRKILFESGALKELRMTEGRIWKMLLSELEELSGPEGDRIKDALNAAAELPVEKGADFFAAYSKAVESGTATLLERWDASSTAQFIFS